MPKKKNRLAKKISAAGSQVQYDASAKKVLSDKNLLSLVLKYCTDEFKCYDAERIRNEFIESEPTVSGRAVEEDERPEDIRGRSTEETGIAEGTAFHDIVFDVKFPDTRKEKYGIINIEAQKSYTAGYPMMKRARYYMGRMTSSQKGTIFKNTDYGKLRKVYSIWIIMNVCERKKNSITVYDTRERQLCGSFRVRKCDYDMQTVIMIGLGDYRKTDNKLLKILDVLFANDMDPGNKVKMLDEMGLDMTEEIKEEINVMCNLGEGIYEQGIEQGIDMGEKKKEEAMLSNIIMSGKLSIEEISKVTGVNYDRVKQLSQQLAAQAYSA